MPCISVPHVTPPVPPLPYTIPPFPVPPIPAQPELCCQLPDIAAMILEHLPPIPLPPGTLNLPGAAQTIITALRAGIDAVQAAIDQAIPDCPNNEDLGL